MSQEWVRRHRRTIIVLNKTKYPLRSDHVLDTSTAAGTEHSGRLNASCCLVQRAMPILCASQRVELFQPRLSVFFFLWRMKCEFFYSGNRVFLIAPAILSAFQHAAVAQFVKKFPALCAISRFIKVSTKPPRLQLKCDGTRRRTGGEVKGKLANGVGSQYPSHYLGTWCIQHYYRWCAHLGC